MEPPPTTPDAPADGPPSKFTTMRMFIGSTLWLLLVWYVYVQMPHTQLVFRDFGVPVPQATSFVLNYAAYLLPLVGLASALLAGVSRSRRGASIPLLWIPLSTIVALGFLLGMPYLALFQSLT